MNPLHAIILGIVEGLTEFLPISSTGHMILASTLFHIPETDFVKTFEIVIQLGAIFAVVILYWNLLMKRKDLWPKLIAAFLPTGIIGLLIYKVLKQYLLGNAFVTVLALGIGGIIFILLEYFLKKKQQTTTDITSVTYTQAIMIGFAQSFSIIPGVSRAAASIFGAMIAGLNRETAVEFSFLLAIPTMIAATGLDLVKSRPIVTGPSLAMLLLGSVVAFFTAMVAIKTFMGYIRNHTFLPFGIYRIIISILFWAVFLRT